MTVEIFVYMLSWLVAGFMVEDASYIVVIFAGIHHPHPHKNAKVDSLPFPWLAERSLTIIIIIPIQNVAAVSNWL